MEVNLTKNGIEFHFNIGRYCKINDCIKRNEWKWSRNWKSKYIQLQDIWYIQSGELPKVGSDWRDRIQELVEYMTMTKAG